MRVNYQRVLIREKRSIFEITTSRLENFADARMPGRSVQVRFTGHLHIFNLPIRHFRSDMKKCNVFLLILIASCVKLEAQSNMPAAKPKGKNNLASFDIHAPVGVFARSHIAGAGLNYSWSHHRYGKGVYGLKLIGFTFNTGADYYLGKRTRIAGYKFQYSDYLYFHFMPGLQINPWYNGNISLTAGPTFGVYKGNTAIGYGANLYGAFFITHTISIGPGITFKKHSEADALWGIAVRGSWAF